MNKFKAGDKVLCCYRLPTPHQHWIHWFHVGIIEEPTDDPKTWNGYNSEKYYCEVTGNIKVRYPFGVTYETGDALFLSPFPEKRMPTDEADAQSVVDLSRKECPEYYARLTETMAEVYRQIYA